MEFPVEVTNGSFSAIAVKSMVSGESGEIQYVYDDSDMITGRSDDYSNITDLVLEDGTRAMIVNGTLVTADGQTLILQDGSDLSQYSVDDNTDEIVISKEQEDQFLQIMTPHGSQHVGQNVIHYIQDDSNDIVMDKQGTNQQILYIQDGENILPIQEQYQIAELDPQNSNEPMHLIKLNNDQILDEVGGVIDLEQLLLSQHGGSVNLESGNYQYAVLKDGKFHLQSANGPVNILRAQEIGNQDDEIILGHQDQMSTADYLDLTAIKGRNTKTGQVITLSRYMDKTLNKKLKAANSNKKENTKTKFDGETTNTTSLSNSLKKLINKKITIGQTDKGKLLVGKIVNVRKKTDKNISENKTNSRTLLKKNQTLRKTFSTSSQKLKDIPEVVNDSSPAVEQNNNTASANNNPSFNRSTSTRTYSSSRKKPQNAIISKPKSSTCQKDSESVQNKNPTKENLNVADGRNSPEHSKIIIHKKVVSKDCFDVISRTLSGLMNMDSVVKKLKNRTIIIKIIEKTYKQDTKNCSKTISYCSGYMVREYKLDDEECDFSESWRFILDTNSKDTILGQDSADTLIQEGVSGQPNLRKFANLTIQITVSPEGNRTTKVIINPPALFQCKACSKSFRTSALLKLHSLDCRPPPELTCTECSLTFKTVAEAREHTSSRHSQENNKGMYECMECNKRFSTPYQIRKHMDMHYTAVSSSGAKQLNILTHPVEQNVNSRLLERKVFSCHICSRQFSRHSNLQRHIEIHRGEGAMYQCAVCNCSYHYISSLTRHIVSCHVEKAKKPQQNANVSQSDSQDSDGASQDQELQFLQDDQIVQMIPLEHMSEESFQHYVTENMDYVAQDFQETSEEVQILQIPVDSNIVIED